MSDKKTLIKGIKYLVTMDARRRVILDAAIAYEGTQITKVGKESELVKDSYDTIIDAGGKICMPGLINAHFHPIQQLSRGLADNVLSPTFLHDRIFPFEAEMSAEDVYWSYMESCLELIKTGTTCFADPGGYHMDRAVQAVTESGIRAVVSRSILDMHTRTRPIPGRIYETTEEAVAKAEEFINDHHGSAEGRIRGSFSLRSDRAISNKACVLVKDLAEKYNVTIQSHLSSHIDGVNRHKEAFDGQRPIERYHKLGVFNRHLIGIHMNNLTDKEVELIVENDVKIAHNPTASFAGAYGTLLGKHPEMVKLGVTVALGSDAAPVSNFNDMFRVMCSLGAHRDVRLDPTLFKPETILEMCLVNGSKALLWEDEIGSLEVGKKADLILLSLDHPEFVPLHNPISNIVFAAAGHCVDTVVINGKTVMEGRKILTFDEKEIMKKAQSAALRVAESTGLSEVSKSKWPLE